MNRYLTRWVVFIDNVNQLIEEDAMDSLLNIASRGKKVGIYLIAGADNVKSRNKESLLESGFTVNLFNNDYNLNNIVKEDPTPILEYNPNVDLAQFIRISTIQNLCSRSC